MANQETDTQTGDPGRTPGSAEGDRETVEQDLQEKQGQDVNEDQKDAGSQGNR